MRAVYYYNSVPITQADIEAAFKRLGLQKGDIVMVHSDIGVIGGLGDIRDKKEFLDSILHAFLNVLGEDGTLIVPAFTYSFCKKEVFDVRNSPSTVGILSEHVRTHEDAVRSVEPIFSCAGIGSYAKELLENVGTVCFGENSLFDRLYKIGGKLMLFGRPFDITYAHYVEREFKVNYRFDKLFTGTIIDENGKSFSSSCIYYVRYLEKNVNYEMGSIATNLTRRGLLQKTDLGNTTLLLSKAKDVYDVGIEMLKANEYAFLDNIP